VAKKEQLVKVFHALADASRCRIIDLLREAGELRVGDVAAAFEMTLNGVSKHLKVLEGAGLIRRRKEGTSHYISVRWEGVAPMVEWLDARRQYWDTRLDAFEAAIKKEESK
jgi:DNA-binding transcriptional ArsR family regulator